ncbi:type IV pilus twitching motility protein PilT [Fastidiosibacter lacustris]|uniref:type IV pilus twitching motility protein PilT n=1 Tax=Fastidiosibacter lacustris TaxID=2056695 RepID=UPI000E34F3E1|nr:type IV pilus twitching motility protein PilT [Fastidiosibacter lacustris]
MNLTQLLSLCVEKKASDLHISSGVAPILRIDGTMEICDQTIITADEVNTLIHNILCKEQLEKFKTQLEYDFSLHKDQIGSRFRVNIFMQNRGPAIVFRTIPEQVYSLEDLHAPEIFKQIIHQPHGLIVVTGPTGSGKSTTLAAMIDRINQTEKGHIISIEDPIEFIHKPNKCLINQREVKRDTLSFNNALRAALREDPDYILVGEMRDIETIRLALTAAETGHLVFTTLHTSSAPKTIDRIINIFPGNEQAMVRAMLSESLQAVIAQRLIRRKEGGRVAAHEILIANTAVRNLIRENKIPQLYNVLQTSQNKGMQTLQQALNKLFLSGIIDDSELKKHENTQPTYD